MQQFITKCGKLLQNVALLRDENLLHLLHIAPLLHNVLLYACIVSLGYFIRYILYIHPVRWAWGATQWLRYL